MIDGWKVAAAVAVIAVAVTYGYAYSRPRVEIIHEGKVYTCIQFASPFFDRMRLECSTP